MHCLLSASLLLVVATTGVLATKFHHCGFNLTQSLDTATTIVQAANHSAILKRDLNGSWLGIVVNGTSATTSDDKGSFITTSLADMDQDERVLYDTPTLSHELRGMRIVEGPRTHKLTVQSYDGAYLLETEQADRSFTTIGEGYYSTFDGLQGKEAKEVDRLTRGDLAIETPGRNRFYNNDLYAIVNATEPAGFEHVVFFLPSSNNSPVILVDQSCRRVQILPYYLLSANMKADEQL